VTIKVGNATVVKLVSKHEEGYLEHCRRYALSSAA
jgi:hypothetical protein